MVEPAAVSKFPEAEPPPTREREPVLTATVPVLLKGKSKVEAPLPAVLVTVPVLLKVERGALRLLVKRESKPRLKAPELLMTAARPVWMTPAFQLMVPALLRVRRVRDLVPPAKVLTV